MPRAPLVYSLNKLLFSQSKKRKKIREHTHTQTFHHAIYLYFPPMCPCTVCVARRLLTTPAHRLRRLARSQPRGACARRPGHFDFLSSDGGGSRWLGASEGAPAAMAVATSLADSPSLPTMRGRLLVSMALSSLVALAPVM